MLMTHSYRAGSAPSHWQCWLIPNEAEMFQRPVAGQFQVEAKAIFALLPKTRVFHIAMGCGEAFEPKVITVLEFQLMA